MAKQLSFKGTIGWGGKRNGAGRPNQSQTVHHMKRALISRKTPMHITWRLSARLPTLRTHKLLKEFHNALAGTKRFGMRVIHFSLQIDHIHMIVEADDNLSLANGMRSLGGRFGKIVRRSINEKSRGPVFNGRYHLRLLASPTQMRNALEYVLINHSKHLKLIEHFDSFSSAPIFRNWKELLGKRFCSLLRDQYEFFKDKEIGEMGLSPPQSWMASQGWLKAKVGFS